MWLKFCKNLTDFLWNLVETEPQFSLFFCLMLLLTLFIFNYKISRFFNAEYAEGNQSWRCHEIITENSGCINLMKQSTHLHNYIISYLNVLIISFLYDFSVICPYKKLFFYTQNFTTQQYYCRHTGMGDVRIFVTLCKELGMCEMNFQRA